MKVLYIPLDFHRHDESPELFTDLVEALGGAVYRSWEHAMVYQPDVILFHGGMNPDELSTLKKFLKVPVYMWTGDCRYIPQESLMMYRDVVDVYLLPFEGRIKDRYQNILRKPCYFLWEPIQNWRFKEPKEMQEGKVVFIGNIYDNLPGAEERMEIMQFLNNRIDNLKAYGSFPGCAELENNRVPEVYNNSYAVIAENNMHDIGWYFTPRNIGGMAAGSCTLMRHFPGIEDFFTDGYDCFIYHHKHELLNIIEFLQNNPDVRNLVAGNGYNRAVANFHVTNFANKFKDIAGFIPLIS